ncbi:serine/threonine-protein phosphatase 6 regulatory ankyrin repeat subunit A-like [Malaya genurostris]|uniref:serine/threonine-protein phosphatase 6 regulatory ankyrin repeat subunit A-like n=1 Tax=Malaya genurostris TaxID=325434 RepID=UPI0026F3DABA|nr:serine/threonine-protein phosphatase 6 regulatory ankyrin repeat subunit A-like [Malaya genurostris]
MVEFNDEDWNDLPGRIDWVIEKLKRLGDDYSPDEVEVDDRFLFLCRIIAQNVDILKQQLKTTYHRVPWEEMEFCLCAFVSSYTIRDEMNFFYAATLTKTRLLKHLKNFLEEIESLKTEMGNKSVNGQTKATRSQNIENIRKRNPAFEGLFADYSQIKEIYSLVRMSRYVTLALTEETEDEDVLCLLFERALQVVGEYLNDSPQSPHLSRKVSDLIFDSFRKEQRKILVDMRNELSHAIINKMYIFGKRAEARRRKLDFREDFSRLNELIQGVVFDKKYQMLITILRSVSVDGEQYPSKQAELTRILENVEFKNFESDYFSSRVVKLAIIFIDNVKKHSSELTDYQKKVIQRIEEIKPKIAMLDKIKAALEQIRNEEAQQNQNHFENRLETLRKFFATEDENIASSALETALLDISAYLEEIRFLFDRGARSTAACLEKNCPVLTGKQMRNYLAHGNALWNILPSDPLVAVLSNIQEILNNQQKASDDRIIAQTYSSFSKWEEKVNIKIESLINQQKMFAAAESGNVEEVINCLKIGADEDGRDFKNWNMFHYAAKGNSSNIFKKFETNKSMQQSEDTEGNQPIHIAARYGNLEIIELLMKDTTVENLNLMNKDGMTPLHFAALNGYTEVVKILLNNGANIEALNMVGVTALHLAALNGHTEVVDSLLTIGANVDAANNFGGTPLHFAVQNGHAEAVRVLLAKGASVVAVLNHSVTPLHIAAQSGYADIVRILLTEGANVDVGAGGFGTPLNFAANNGHTEVVTILLSEGATADAANNAGFTPLHLAAQSGHTEVVKILLTKVSNINATTEHRMSPLHFAASNGHLEVVKILLTKGANKNATNRNGLSVLHFAANNGHAEVVELLLTEGANVDATNIDGWTALHFAADRGHTAAVTILLIKSANVGATLKDGCTPLHLAAQNGHTEIVTILLTNGANVDAECTNRATPLLMAAKNGHTGVVTILVNKCRNVDAATSDGETPLYIAAQNGHIEVVEILLTNGADVDASERDGVTALHIAVQNDHEEVVNILLTKGAKIEAADKNGETPLHFAANNGRTEIVNILLAKGANIHATNVYVSTSLHIAVLNGHNEIVSILLTAGVDANATNKANQKPLHLAALKGHSAIVSILLSKGANVDVTLNDGGTPLHIAAFHGHTEVVIILLSKGANVDAITKRGLTALNLAAHKGHAEVIRTLLTNGAKKDATDSDGLKPVDLAKQKDHEEAVNTMLSNHSKLSPACDSSCQLQNEN